jgi:hemerythrin superfamily protein
MDNTSSNTPPNTTSKGQGDVVAFLRQQHDQVRSLFTSLTGGTGSEQDWDMLLRLLAVHETAEEEVVYPAVKAQGDEGRTIAQARLAEEDQAKKTLRDLEKLSFKGDGFTEQLTKFQQMVEAHAEAEEREVFPLLESKLEPGTLKTMRTALQAAEGMAPTHPHKLAPESAVGNMIAGPVVALMDRVRDAIRAVTK